VDYTLVKVKLLQSWRYKTLAVIKRHKKHLSLSYILLSFIVTWSLNLVTNIAFVDLLDSTGFWFKFLLT